MSALAASAAAPPAYRDGNVARWLTAYTASVTGDLVYFLALTWTAARLTGPAGTGLIVAVGAVPRVLFLLAGGAVVDRFGPRPVAIASDTTRCAVILAGALTVTLLPAQVWLLAVVALVFGVVDALFLPAVGAFPPRIADAGQLLRVQGMRGLAVRLANAVGPLLAGIALVAGGPGAGFAVAGVLFAASLALLLAVRVRPLPPADRAPRGHGLRGGGRFLRGHRALLPLIAVIGLSEMCFSGPVATGLVLLADERHWGAAGMAWIAGAFSVGGALAGLLLTVRAGLRRAGWAVVGSLVATAAATVALGLVGGLTAAVGLGAAAGLTSGITMTITGALVQAAVPPDYLGRVTALTSLGTLGLAPVLLPAVGFVVAWWGAATFFAGCAGVCLLAAALGITAPSVRRAVV